MPDYHIDPKAPLLFRDGRPFDAGGVAETLPFPLPSTIAGAFRTAYADENEIDFAKNADQLLKISIAGPLLSVTETGAEGEEEHKIFFPAPADAVCLNSEQGAKIHRLKPEKLGDNEGTDLPDIELLPLFMNSDSQNKPSSKAPAYWQPESMTKWLLDNSDEIDASTVGVGPLPQALRTHVKMQSVTLTTDPGRLFQTVGLDCGEQKLKSDDKVRYGWESKRYGFAIQCPESLPATCRTVGGESRLAKITPVEKLWPECSQELKNKLIEATAIRLVLVTPALFDDGWLPAWLKEETLPGTSLKLKLRAVANPRWQAVSGWAMRPGSEGKKQLGAKPVRRAVPAGAVYWFDVLAGDPSEIPDLWLKSISDQQADDGFGLVIPGIWSKKPAQQANS